MENYYSLLHWFLPASTDGSDKKDCKKERFKLIYQALKPGEELLTKSRVKFLYYICDLLSSFLKQFQSEKPNIQKNFTNSYNLVGSLAKLIMRPQMFIQLDEFIDRGEIDWYAR